MPRPPRCRRICSAPRVERFCPCNVAESAPILLTLDEYEVIRLVDLKQQTHEQCAAQMDISRSTVQEIYENARRKLAACLVYGKPLHITGGNVRICSGQEQRSESCYRAGACNRAGQDDISETPGVGSACGCAGQDYTDGTPGVGNACGCASQDDTGGTPGVGSACGSAGKSGTCCTSGLTSDHKGDIIMRIAVTYENGQIFQHFGHTAQFKIYDVANGEIVRAEVVDTNGSGHGALAGFLMQLGVDALICGGIGGGAQMALAEVGIRLFGGFSGDADAAVNALIAGNLGYNPDVHCDHHDHEHGEGEHSCGSHGCGNHGCH